MEERKRRLKLICHQKVNFCDTFVISQHLFRAECQTESPRTPWGRGWSKRRNSWVLALHTEPEIITKASPSHWETRQKGTSWFWGFESGVVKLWANPQVIPPDASLESQPCLHDAHSSGNWCGSLGWHQHSNYTELTHPLAFYVHRGLSSFRQLFPNELKSVLQIINSLPFFSLVILDLICFNKKKPIFNIYTT